MSRLGFCSDLQTFGRRRFLGFGAGAAGQRTVGPGFSRRLQPGETRPLPSLARFSGRQIGSYPSRSFMKAKLASCRPLKRAYSDRIADFPRLKPGATVLRRLRRLETGPKGFFSSCGWVLCDLKHIRRDENPFEANLDSSVVCHTGLVMRSTAPHRWIRVRRLLPQSQSHGSFALVWHRHSCLCSF